MGHVEFICGPAAKGLREAQKQRKEIMSNETTDVAVQDAMLGRPEAKAMPMQCSYIYQCEDLNPADLYQQKLEKAAWHKTLPCEKSHTLPAGWQPECCKVRTGPSAS